MPSSSAHLLSRVAPDEEPLAKQLTTWRTDSRPPGRRAGPL